MQGKMMRIEGVQSDFPSLDLGIGTWVLVW